MLTRHSPVLSWNWKHLINRKVQAKKVFWHIILHDCLCNALCKFFIKIKATNVFPKYILKSKARGQSIQVRKKLLCNVIIKNHLCNILCKFLIKMEVWNQRTDTPANFTVIWSGCQKQPPEVFYKKAVRKNFAIFAENNCVGVSLKKVKKETPAQVFSCE